MVHTPLSVSQLPNVFSLHPWSLALILVVTCPLLTLAQGSARSSVGTGGTHVIQGYIFFPSGRRADGPVQVKLQSHVASELSVTLDSSGSFLFSSLAPASYTVVVDAGPEYEKAREVVVIDTDVNLSRMGVPVVNTSRRYSVMIHLQVKAAGARNKPGVVNAALAAVPENARKLYDKGLELSRAGETSKAVDSLKEAVVLYPSFPLALNELGVLYLKLGKADTAVGVLDRAVKLEPATFTPRLNLGIALLEAKRFQDARLHLTEASKQNASAPTPHMYLGITLAHLGKDVEAEKELLKAVEVGGNHLGLPHYYLGGLYWRQRDYARAVEHLEKYLELTPNAADAEKVRGTIKDLRSRI